MSLSIYIFPISTAAVWHTSGPSWTYLSLSDPHYIFQNYYYLMVLGGPNIRIIIGMI